LAEHGFGHFKSKLPLTSIVDRKNGKCMLALSSVGLDFGNRSNRSGNRSKWL